MRLKLVRAADWGTAATAAAPGAAPALAALAAGIARSARRLAKGGDRAAERSRLAALCHLVQTAGAQLGAAAGPETRVHPGEAWDLLRRLAEAAAGAPAGAATGGGEGAAEGAGEGATAARGGDAPRFCPCLFAPDVLAEAADAGARYGKLTVGAALARLRTLPPPKAPAAWLEAFDTAKRQGFGLLLLCGAEDLAPAPASDGEGRRHARA